VDWETAANNCEHRRGGEGVRQEMREMPILSGSIAHTLLATYTRTYTTRARIRWRLGLMLNYLRCPASEGKLGVVEQGALAGSATGRRQSVGEYEPDCRPRQELQGHHEGRAGYTRMPHYQSFGWLMSLVGSRTYCDATHSSVANGAKQTSDVGHHRLRSVENDPKETPLAVA
jgi:hypothetical protein